MKHAVFSPYCEVFENEIKHSQVFATSSQVELKLRRIKIKYCYYKLSDCNVSETVVMAIISFVSSF